MGENASDVGRVSDDELAQAERTIQRALGERFEPPSDLPSPAVRRAAERRDHGLIYFVQVQPDGPVKIGSTLRHRLAARLRALQGANPYPLRLVGVMRGDFSTERDLHATFAHLRIHGEWFRPEDALEALIRGLA